MRHQIDAVRFDHNLFFFLNQPASLESLGIETDLDTEDDWAALELEDGGLLEAFAGARCSVRVTLWSPPPMMPI